jgi:hypothetical protein
MTWQELDQLKTFLAQIEDSVGLLRDIIDDLVDEAETIQPLATAPGMVSALRCELAEVLSAIDDIDVAVCTLEMHEIEDALALLDTDHADKEPGRA